MEETIINWSNGSMGHTVYCLLHVCSKELDKNYNLPIGKNFHSLSGNIGNINPSIKKIHGPYIVLEPSNTNIVCSSQDNLLIQLLRLYKWYEKVPTYDDLVYFNLDSGISNPEKLERLVLWLYAFPSFKYNFEILDFFKDDAVLRMQEFIKSRGLTPNNRIDEFLNIVYQMNISILDEYNWLRDICISALQSDDKKINLSLHQQAFIMTWMMRLGYKFKLMPQATNTKTFRQFLEE